jgi:hypothetical protein
LAFRNSPLYCTVHCKVPCMVAGVKRLRNNPVEMVEAGLALHREAHERAKG